MRIPETFTDILEDNLRHRGAAAVADYRRHMFVFMAGPVADDVFPELGTYGHEAGHALAHYLTRHESGHGVGSIAVFTDSDGQTSGGICSPAVDLGAALKSFEASAILGSDMDRVLDYCAVLVVAGYEDPFTEILYDLRAKFREERHRTAITALAVTARESGGFLAADEVQQIIETFLGGGV